MIHHVKCYTLFTTKKFAFMSRQEAFPAEMPWLVGGRVAGHFYRDGVLWYSK